jgi:hypothetical protein
MPLAERTRPDISASSLRANLDVVLKPLLRPELSDIRIDSELTIGRTDEPFAGYTHEVVRLLSRRHACISSKGGSVYLVDLGSRNGTTVNRVAVGQAFCRLRDGDEICLGGELSYRVGITARFDSSVNRSTEPDLPLASAHDRTRFLDAPGAFLEVLCHAAEPKERAARGTSAVVAAGARQAAARPLGRVMSWMREFVSLDGNEQPGGQGRRWLKAAAVAGVLAALALTPYVWNSSDRDLQRQIARGEYSRAAALADRLLERHPDDAGLKARAIDIVLKANAPGWLARVRARDFDGADHVLGSMSAFSAHTAALRPLVGELQWLGDLERLQSTRGGSEAPFRIYADEGSIESLIGRWNDDNGEHQRTLARIAAHVPEFADWYGEALSYLRRLQSESAVYLPVIARVKELIASELSRDDPEALEPLLAEMSGRYPDLGGLDSVRQDLSHYIEIRQEARTRQSGRLFALLAKARLVTPPFEQSLRGLMETGQLPSTELLREYNVATQNWKDGHFDAESAALQKMTSGPWGDEAAAELERRRAVSARFPAIQQPRTAGDFLDQLLAFAQSLDADEDVYFVQATADDLKQQTDSVVAREQEAMNRARTLWQQYRRSGAIDVAQRIESSVSDQFRSRALLLAEAHRFAQQALLISSLLDTAAAAQWSMIQNEIETEVRQQRRSLCDLGNVLRPELLQAKLVLLGVGNE